MPTMWFEHDKEFLLNNYLLKNRLNGVIPLNKQQIEAAANCLKEWKDLMILMDQSQEGKVLFMF